MVPFSVQCGEESYRLKNFEFLSKISQADICKGDSVKIPESKDFSRAVCGQHDSYRVKLQDFFGKFNVEFNSKQAKEHTHQGFSCKVQLGKSDVELGEYEGNYLNT